MLMLHPSFKHRSPKTWHKVSVRVESLMTDAVAAYLADLTGAGLEITSPGHDLPKGEKPCRTEKITAYIPIGLGRADRRAAQKKIRTLRKFLAELNLFFPGCPVPELHTETILEEDWGEKWKRFFTAFQITPRLTIKPSWEAAEKQEEKPGIQRAVIEMDPGLAFGTGHHASTQLALMLLEQLFHNGTAKPEKVLDVGTGSGILAMACGIYGAREVLALDNDPDALETATANILRNRLEDTVKVSGLDVKALKPAFHLVVANITRDTLAELAKPLVRLVHPGGFLVLSGILQGEQGHAIREIYTKQGLTCLKSLAKDEWAALLLQKI